MPWHDCVAISKQGGGRNMKLLDVFCGIGGWSRVFTARGWSCTGVDCQNFSKDYPGRFIVADALTLDEDWIQTFDAVVMSPPCDDFARAWLPWLRGDKEPEESAINLLKWSIKNCQGKRKLVECSRFAGRHVGGHVEVNNYCLWGDVPLLIREIPREKMKTSGTKPEVRAAIPYELALSVAEWFEASLLME